MSRSPTERQQHIAHLLGISIRGDTQAVAAARIFDAVEPGIYPEAKSRGATPRQIDFARSLGLEVSGDSFRVCSAKIDDALRARNEQALAQLGLRPGDRVVKTEKSLLEGQEHTISREYTVSSIGADLRVWFKGGNGAGAWPTQLSRLPPAGISAA